MKMLNFHIVVGLISLVAGASALILGKGSDAHRKAGLVFVVAMLAITISGGLLAFLRPAYIAVIAAVLTLYLVVTALLVIRSKPKTSSVLDVLGLIVIVITCGASVY